MAIKDPEYVRLNENLSVGCIGDVHGSGWFIGGMDIKKFPEDSDPVAQRFVRGEFRVGKLETATPKEFGIVTDANEKMRSTYIKQLDEHEATDRQGHQEQQMISLASKTKTALLAARFDNNDDDNDDDDDDDEAKEARRPPNSRRKPSTTLNTDTDK